MAEIGEEIRAVSAGVSLATGENYDSLLSELSRLRGEYCQLEHDRKAAA